MCREFGAAALSSGVWVYSHCGCAWEFPSWVGAFEMQSQSKPHAPARGGGHCLSGTSKRGLASPVGCLMLPAARLPPLPVQLL